MQQKSPLDTGFLAPQFSVGRRRDSWPGSQDELEATSSHTGSAHEPPQPQEAGWRGLTQDQSQGSVQAALQAALQGALQGADPAPGPKVNIRRSRRISVAPEESLPQRAEVERPARVFLVRTTSVVAAEPGRAVTPISPEQSLAPQTAPADAPGDAQIAIGGKPEAALTSNGPLPMPVPRRRRVPDFKKPSRGVIIKTPADKVVPAAVAAEDVPTLEEMRQQLSALEFTRSPERFEFDLTFRSRWNEVESALQRLRELTRPSAVKDFFIPGSRRRR